MLIVGDAAMPEANLKDIEFTEVVVSNNQVESLVKTLELEGASPLSVSQSAKLYYRQADNRRFILHSVGTNFQLQRLIDSYGANTEVKLATPATNYVFMWTLQNTRFKSASMWVRKLKQIKKLRPYFERDYHKAADNQKFRSIGRYMYYHLKQLSIFPDTEFRYSDFEYFNKYAIANLVTSEVSTNKAYNRITVDRCDHFYIENIFRNTLDEKQQMHAMMDKLYIDTINEYFVPELVVEERFPLRSKWKDLFITSIMNTYLIDNIDHDMFREYIYFNIEKIIENYEHGAFDTFIMAYHKKAIKFNKKNK
jgi:hypothetical protein